MYLNKIAKKISDQHSKSVQKWREICDASKKYPGLDKECGKLEGECMALQWAFNIVNHEIDRKPNPDEGINPDDFPVDLG